MNRLFIKGVIIFFIGQSAYADDPVWGRLANPGYENQPIKSTLFFTGNWRNDVQFYDYNPASNIGLYTIFPADARHLGWSESYANRKFAINTLIDAGVNVVNMSYWGLPGTDNWAYWAPMQTSTASHDELFDVTTGKNILIAPYIESYSATNDFAGFSFMDDFSGSVSNPAPQLLVLIQDLVDRYLVNPDNTQWPNKWARVYDKDGAERYLISIIHVASNQSSINDQSFAEGFDLLADKIYSTTEVRVGFALDILPPDTYAPGTFKATPLTTGPWMAQQSSVLAIQCFIPEIWKGISDEHELITWKNTFAQGWINTGIPFIHDISPGYDAHIVFPGSPKYGNNHTWRELQDQAITNFESQSFTFNAWNGYTEGFAGVPTAEYSDTTYLWVCDIFSGSCGENPDNISNDQNEIVSFEVFPNPSGQNTRIRFRLNKTGFVTLELLNTTGESITTLLKEEKSPGIYSIDCSPHNIPCGIYLICFKMDQTVHVQRLVIK